MRQRYEHYSDDEKKRFIMECRQSGMSDHQWCRENGINSSTFYYWIKKFRNTACQGALIEPVASHKAISSRQDVVKVNIIPNGEKSSTYSPIKSSADTESVSIELNLNGCSIKIYNSADPALLAHTINLLRGDIC